MSTFLSTLAWGFVALLAVATAVALWEHGHAQAARKRRALPPAPQPRRAAGLDVDLDHLPEAPAPAEGDQAQRQAALGGALGRMAAAPAGTSRSAGQGWTETQPMVAASLQVEWPEEQATAHTTDTPRA